MKPPNPRANRAYRDLLRIQEFPFRKFDLIYFQFFILSEATFLRNTSAWGCVPVQGSIKHFESRSSRNDTKEIRRNHSIGCDVFILSLRCAKHNRKVSIFFLRFLVQKRLRLLDIGNSLLFFIFAANSMTLFPSRRQFHEKPFAHH